MAFYVGLILTAIVLAFVTYQLGWGGGQHEHGRRQGWLPYW